MSTTQDHSENIEAILKDIPQQPGVYQFFDEHDLLLYIGKATNLRSRVRSYFRASTQLSNAKVFMVKMIRNIEYTVVDSEPEALLLETTLIKKYKPPYNVVMKDDKNFQYIHITDDEYPLLETVRKLGKRREGVYFGPYISGRAVRRTLRMLKTLFRFCESPPVEKRGKIFFPKRPCLDYHLGRCVGPCAKVVTPEEYQQLFAHIADFLAGDYEPIAQQVRVTMHEASAKKQFEKAARMRDQLEAIESLMAEQKVVSTKRENADYLSLAQAKTMAAVNMFMVRKGLMVHQETFLLQNTKDQSPDEIMDAFADQYYAQTVTQPHNVYKSTETRRGKHRRLLAMGMKNAQESLERYGASLQKRERRTEAGLQELGEGIGLKAPPQRVEIYDISNNQGKFSVGSMVVFIDGKPAPSQYRKFKIKTVEGPDDFASMKEVLDRRLQHLPGKANAERDNAWPRPDLIIIDGGKGQLSAAYSILQILKLNIPMVSLAKKEEELFLPGESESVRLPEGSAGLHLVQRMRDEAHRFAIGFYRSRHLKDLV